MIPSPEQHKAALDAAMKTIDVTIFTAMRGAIEKAIAAYLSALPEQQGEAEAARELALNCAINTQANRADRAESDLSAAREEIADLELIIQGMQQHYNPGADQFDTAAAIEALRSSRAKRNSRRVAVPSSDLGADLANAADLPEHLRWKGNGPAPASWFSADGTKVYRSYRDYCDD